MTTLCDVTGAVYPTTFNGHDIEPMEGVSLRAAWSGQPLQRPQPIFFNHEDNRAVRDVQWKLVALKGQPWELYDMAADRTELNDLSKQHPDRVANMSAQYDAWAKRTHVVIDDEIAPQKPRPRKKKQAASDPNPK